MWPETRRTIVPSVDVDFDINSPTRRRIEAIGERIEHFQRLVVNPFLALLALDCWSIGLVWLSRKLPSVYLPLYFLILPIMVPLIQFHCRDCGGSERYRTWREHTCASVESRRREGSPRRWRGPSPPVQLNAWLYLIGAMILLLAVVGKLPNPWLR